MGGFGSGRPGWRIKAEHCWSLDVNKLNRAGCLEPGYVGGWQWWQDGERVASIGLEAKHGWLILNYRHRPYGDEWQETRELIPILWKPCRFGGKRPFFACPGIVKNRHCGRHVIKLYSAARYYLCRHCYGLTYASRCEAEFDRLLRKANKLRRSLDGEPGTESLIPSKPKGMWWRTYEARVDRIEELELAADQYFGEWMQRRFGNFSLFDADT